MSITSLLHLQNSTAITCPITGITLTVSFPNCGIDFTYQNPLSSYKNIKKIASLPPAKLHSLPKNILAGVLLGVLSHANLLEKFETSSTEANIFFQQIPSSLLCNAIKLFSQEFSSSFLEVLPHFSLSSIHENTAVSTAEDMLKNYCTICREFINPIPNNKVNIIIPSHSKETKPTAYFTPEIRKEAKECIKEMEKDILMYPKLHSILKLLVTKENLITVSDEMRQKVLDRIEAFQTPASIRFTEILTRCGKNSKNIDMDRLSDTFEIVTTRKTLSEILAEKAEKAEMKGGN